MINTSFFYSAIFIAIGVVAWSITGMEQTTALIPAFFGILLVLIATFSKLKESLRPHLMHAAMALVLLGLLGSIGGLFRLVGSVLTGAELERPIAVYAQTLFALASMGYLYAGVRSFIEARKNRASQVD
jgi:uncharacterized protein YacL